MKGGNTIAKSQGSHAKGQGPKDQDSSQGAPAEADAAQEAEVTPVGARPQETNPKYAEPGPFFYCSVCGNRIRFVPRLSFIDMPTAFESLCESCGLRIIVLREVQAAEVIRLAYAEGGK